MLEETKIFFPSDPLPNVQGLSIINEQEIADLLREEEATIAVVDLVTPAVVSVNIEKEFSGSETGYITVGSGTGFFVSADGMILTNKHVASDPDYHYTVITNNGEEHEATLLARDVFLDIALLDIEGENYPTVTLADSSAVRVGETVIAIGNPLGEFPNSVTKGIISGLNRTIMAGDGLGEVETIREAIQTDAAINEGNSGGPLINLSGEVVGINTAIAFDGQSLGFAIPINEAKKAIDDVSEFGRIVRPWLGVRYLMIDSDVQKEFSLSVSEGALIIPTEAAEGQESVIAESPAQKAGLLPGDIILKVQEFMLNKEMILSDAINTFAPENIVSLQVLRGEETLTISVTLSELDPSLFQ